MVRFVPSLVSIVMLLSSVADARTHALTSAPNGNPAPNPAEVLLAAKRTLPALESQRAKLAKRRPISAPEIADAINSTTRTLESVAAQRKAVRDALVLFGPGEAKEVIGAAAVIGEVDAIVKALEAELKVAERVPPPFDENGMQPFLSKEAEALTKRLREARSKARDAREKYDDAWSRFVDTLLNSRELDGRRAALDQAKRELQDVKQRKADFDKRDKLNRENDDFDPLESLETSIRLMVQEELATRKIRAAEGDYVSLQRGLSSKVSNATVAALLRADRDLGALHSELDWFRLRFEAQPLRLHGELLRNP